MKITPNQWTILESLKDGPGWIRSFQAVRPLLDDLLDKGMVEQCRPPLGRGRNMVRLTVAGCEGLEIPFESVPTERAKPVLEAKPDFGPGKIKAGVSAEVRERCEAFLRGIASGESPSEVVGHLSAAYGVQRPAIWRNLRTGGIIEPYAKRHEGGRGRPLGGGQPGFSARRRQASVRTAEAREEALERKLRSVVSRDPCPRCGVRADIGCQHSHQRIGMAFS